MCVCVCVRLLRSVSRYSVSHSLGRFLGLRLFLFDFFFPRIEWLSRWTRIQNQTRGFPIERNGRFVLNLDQVIERLGSVCGKRLDSCCPTMLLSVMRWHELWKNWSLRRGWPQSDILAKPREREVSRLHYGAFCSLRVCALWSPTHRLVSLNNNRHYEHITLRLKGGCLCPPFNAPCSLKEVDFAGRRHCGARHKTHREIREKSWSASWFMMMDSACVCVAAQSNDMEERLSKVLWLCNSVADSLFRAEQQNLKRRLSCFLFLFLVCCFFLIYTFRFCL